MITLKVEITKTKKLYMNRLEIKSTKDTSKHSLSSISHKVKTKLFSKNILHVLT